MKKKLLAAILSGAMALSLCACGGGEEAAEDTSAEATYTVGICQLVEHVALDAATDGFMDAINDELGEGVVDFDEQNAQNDSNTCCDNIGNG